MLGKAFFNFSLTAVFYMFCFTIQSVTTCLENLQCKFSFQGLLCNPLISIPKQHLDIVSKNHDSLHQRIVLWLILCKELQIGHDLVAVLLHHINCNQYLPFPQASIVESCQNTHCGDTESTWKTPLLWTD